MNLLEILALIAGTMGVSSFVPQLVKCLKTKETKDLSLPMYFVISMSLFLWIIYGIITHQLALTLTNSVALLLTVAILLLKLKYG